MSTQEGSQTAVDPAPSHPNIRKPNPALLEHARERAKSRENRFADRVTAFSGSMRFVYIHIIWFGCWIGFGLEEYPYGLLTMIVSLEAIFLSTFVLISQNRADVRRQVVADQQWTTVQEEEAQNIELLDLSRQILKLTKEVHFLTRSRADHSDDRGQPSPLGLISHEISQTNPTTTTKSLPAVDSTQSQSPLMELKADSQLSPDRCIPGNPVSS